MADITGIAAACAAVGSAACVIAQAFGIEPAALFWAFSGAGFGLGVPRQSTRARILIAFPFAILGGSALGAWVSAEWFDGSARAVAWCSFVAGFVIHPAGELLIKHLETAFVALLSQLRIRR